MQPVSQVRYHRAIERLASPHSTSQPWKKANFSQTSVGTGLGGMGVVVVAGGFGLSVLAGTLEEDPYARLVGFSGVRRAYPPIEAMVRAMMQAEMSRIFSGDVASRKNSSILKLVKEPLKTGIL